MYALAGSPSNAAHLVNVVTETRSGVGRRHGVPPGAVVDTDIKQLLAVDWDVPNLRRGLVRHAVRDAGRGAGFFVGTTPETWSPLAASGRGAFAKARTGWDMADMVRAGRGLPSATSRVTMSQRIEIAKAPHVFTFDVDDELTAVMAVADDAFACAIPAEMAVVTVRVTRGGHLPNAAEFDALPFRSTKEAAAPPGFDEMIVWRIYSGNNSWIRDAWTAAERGVHRLVLGAEHGACFAVGRAIRTRARSLDAERGDPLFEWRVAKAEGDSSIVDLVPRLDHVRTVDRVVIAVHGTMSCSVGLADALAALAPPGLPLARFEHDTWHSLERNARELVDLIESRVTQEVHLVAHSRGGLVAARAAQIIRLRKQLTISVTTMGTPFDGTPVAVAVEVGYMGVRALLGGFRAGGGPVVDVLTRLAGFALKSGPPRGITLMYPSNDALPLLRDTLDALTAIAAHADGSSSDRFGLVGFAQGVFGGDASDLVVSTTSASHGNAMTVDCDHFSYGQNSVVQDALRAALAVHPGSGRLKLLVPPADLDVI